MLVAFADVRPSYILVKVKLHCLTHLLEDVERFGPAIRKSTEVFEKYNSVFRHCVILSNRQADSRDAADRFALMDVTANAASGGWFADEQPGRGWRQAGRAVQGLLSKHTILQSHFGWVGSRERTPGKSTIMSEMSLYSTIVMSGRVSKQEKVLAIEAESGDSCRIGSWVVVERVCDVSRSP